MRFSIKKYFTQKIRITANKALTEEELWHVNMSRISIHVLAILLLVLIMAASIMLTIKTPLANYIPGFHGKKAQLELVKALNRLDSLSEQVNRWEKYNGNLMLVLEGGNTISQAVDSITKSEHKISPRSVLDSLLRERVMRDSVFIGKSKSNPRGLFEMLPPASGMITSRFNPQNGEYGITLSPPPSGAILSVMDGTIINTGWEANGGWTVTIQHAGGFISVYRQIATLMQKSGNRINAGEAIGLAASLDSGAVPKLVFELWYNGYLVDPENYITF